MREIVLDTETTGLDPREGHRIVEIGAVELVERVRTGRELHLYLNPGRPMPPEAEKVHGLTDAFLADKPRFAEVAERLLDFLADAPIIAHNAPFDWRFLCHELEDAGRPALAFERMIDTVELARSRLPGAKHSLDALCQRYGIDLSRRTLHGALLDAGLLAEVYVELTGGRQMGFDLATAAAVGPARRERRFRPARTFALPADEAAAHAAFIADLPGAIWARSAS